jgi:hypothetical protein
VRVPPPGADEGVQPEADRPLEPLVPGMRRLLLIAAVLVLLAGTQLFVFTERTAEYFAWTIANPLTAAFLGAAYWGSFIIELLAARARLWAYARIAVPTVLVFTVLTLGVTLWHLEQFHLGPTFGLNTQLVTWLWIAIYTVVPVLLVIVLVVQARTPGVAPPTRTPTPAWLNLLVGAQAVVLLGLGLWLLVDPLGAGRAVWPWQLTPLTGRAIGAWLFSLGIAAVHALVERDLARLGPAAWGYLVISALQLVALARYPDVPDWGSPRTVCYVGFLLSMLVVGGAALIGARASSAAGAHRPPRRRESDAAP